MQRYRVTYEARVMGALGAFALTFRDVEAESPDAARRQALVVLHQEGYEGRFPSTVELLK